MWNDGYATTTSFASVFGFEPVLWKSPGGDATPTTLLNALLANQPSGEAPLAQQAVAAVLNATDSDELATGYRFTEAEVVAAVRWVYGLDSDIDQDGDINVNAAADNVYNATLGGELQTVLEYWNTVEDEPGYVDGEGFCIELPSGETPDSLFETLGWQL